MKSSSKPRSTALELQQEAILQTASAPAVLQTASALDEGWQIDFGPSSDHAMKMANPKARSVPDFTLLCWIQILTDVFLWMWKKSPCSGPRPQRPSQIVFMAKMDHILLWQIQLGSWLSIWSKSLHVRFGDFTSVDGSYFLKWNENLDHLHISKGISADSKKWTLLLESLNYIFDRAIREWDKFQTKEFDLICDMAPASPDTASSRHSNSDNDLPDKNDPDWMPAKKFPLSNFGWSGNIMPGEMKGYVTAVKLAPRVSICGEAVLKEARA